jgi:hypothetical protein
MSLTSFLKNKDVKVKFSQEFSLQKFDLNSDILAPPVTKHYMLVGVAFDYLLRFYIKRLNSRVVTSHRWVAELVPELVADDKILYKKCKDIISDAKANYSDYIKSGEMKDELIKSALLLAQVDAIFRGGLRAVGEGFGTVDDGDITDLKNLVLIIDPKIFKSKKVCSLNPTFGLASNLIGGADADLIIDNMLIDIKTTKNPTFTRNYFNQLIGYYVLSLIGGIWSDTEETPPTNVDTLGIYYSRHAQLYTIPVENVIDEDRFPSFIKWFKERARTELSQNLESLNQHLKPETKKDENYLIKIDQILIKYEKMGKGAYENELEIKGGSDSSKPYDELSEQQKAYYRSLARYLIIPELPKEVFYDD